MKKLLLLFIVPLLGYNQCSNAIQEIENQIIISSTPEKIAELNNNQLAAYIGINSICSNNCKDVIYAMGVETYYNNTEYELSPRNISFMFSDYSTIDIRADELNLSSKGQYAFFQLSDINLSILETKQLMEIKLYDHRNKKTITGYPYSKIIIEQIDCLRKKQAQQSR